jgi:recombinational DNA repair protein (RecF pathway)
MQLSRNFSLQELIKSDTAIRKGINNNPNAEQIEKLKLFVKIFYSQYVTTSVESKSRQDSFPAACAKP